MQIDARTRSRIAMRREVADAAFDVLVERGYENVSVDELVRTIGISRATFFRYFESKEDVVIATAAPPEIDVDAEIRALGDEVGSKPLLAVFRILRATLPGRDEQAGRLRARVRMTSTTPAIGARLALRRGARQAELGSALEGAIGDRETALVCSAIGFSCLDLAWREWARSDTSELQDEYSRIVARAQSSL